MWLNAEMRMGRRQGSVGPRWGYNEEIIVWRAKFPPRSGPLFRIIHLFHVESRASVPHVQTTHPKNDVLGDIGGMIGYALEISCRQHELQARPRLRLLLDHPRDQVFKNLVAIAVHHIVRLQHLA